MKCRIHRGCHEIGGNCIEIESQGKRIVLDIGLPLNDDPSIELPDIRGLQSPDESLLSIFISHPHPDHYGLLAKIPQPVPVYMGEAARRIISVSSFFTPLPHLGEIEPLSYHDRQSIQAGPFTITPYLVDHSAYDSHCLLVEADGARLFYSGDIRAHGRNAQAFEKIVNSPPTDVDVLICEGTQIGRDGGFDFPNEASVADKMAEIFTSTNGLCLVWCSSQNVDRVATVFEAAKRANRQLILDMYTAEIMRAADDSSLPKPGNDGVYVYLPKSQKRQILKQQAFDIPKPYYPHRTYPEALASAAPRSVMIFRPSMFRELREAKCLDGAALITSIWSGYARQSPTPLDAIKQASIQHHHVHTSGHATIGELKQFIAAFPTSRIVPIHLEDRDGFTQLSPKVELRNDGEWWEV